MGRKIVGSRAVTAEKLKNLTDCVSNLQADNDRLRAASNTLSIIIAKLRQENHDLSRRASRENRMREVQHARDNKFLKMRQETFDARRLSTAATIMGAFLQYPTDGLDSRRKDAQSIAESARYYADALLRELGMERPE